MLHPPELDVDLDDRRVHGIGPGDRRRLVVVGLLQPGVDARRAAVIPARTRGLRHLGERHLGTRARRRCRRRRCAARGRRGAHSSRLAAMAKTFSRSRSLAWWMAADKVTVLRLAIVPKPIAIAAVSASDDDDVVGLDRPGVGDDLREDRLHALALRAGAATRRRSCRTDRSAPSRSRTGRRRCPRHSSRSRARDSGPARAPPAGAREMPSTPPIPTERLVAARPDSRRRRRRSARRRDRECPRR